MRALVFRCASYVFSLLSALSVFAQARSVAITVDDLPYASGTPAGVDPSAGSAAAELVNRKLLAAFHAHHVPVTGFVNQKYVGAPGMKSGTGILKAWIGGGFDLGNHTHSHSDINDLSVEQRLCAASR